MVAPRLGVKAGSAIPRDSNAGSTADTQANEQLLTEDPQANPPEATCPPQGWTAALLATELQATVDRSGGRLTRRVLGQSWEGRDIEVIEAGRGPTRVAAWSHMHGDEQTFTTTVVNLFRRIADRAEQVDHLLSRCRLQIIPMLNPDGAERRTRVNAQGVDINRDALQNATPEGRVLAKLINDFSPHYALNLHNQSHRRWMPGYTAPVSLSLLAPPANPACRPTEAVEAAQRLGACVVQAASPECGGRITRYDAGYMPRAFGEWVQSSGVPTLLLEAGGWPGQDVAALESLCLRALLATLGSIASGECQEASPSPYNTLPLASEWESFDLLIRRTRLPSPCGAASNAVDIGINRSNNSIMPSAADKAAVVDVGDLHVFPLHDVLEAEGRVCEHGKQVVVAGAASGGQLDHATIEHHLRQGVTTVLAVVEADADELPAVVRSLTSGRRPDANIGLLWRPPAGESSIVGRPLVELPLEVIGAAPPSGANGHSADIGVNGSVTVGATADLVLRDFDPDKAKLRASRPRHVLVGGTPVVADDEIIARGAGKWLSRTPTGGLATS
ncbi:MAG: M14 family zinc carboxypeptidase [Planctomycetota bacterium]